MNRIIRAALVVVTAAAAAIIPAATADAANVSAAQRAPLGGHLTIGYVYGDEGYDTVPLWRGEFNATNVVSQTTSGSWWWPTTTTVVTGTARAARVNMPDSARTGMVTLTEVQKPFAPLEISYTAFDGWLKGSAQLVGAHGFSGNFSTTDGHFGPIGVLDDAKMSAPAQTTAAEYPFIATVLSGPDLGALPIGDFHINQIGTLVGGNFLSLAGIYTVIGDTDGHQVLMHMKN